jgi:hypothetical protein
MNVGMFRMTKHYVVDNDCVSAFVVWFSANIVKEQLLPHRRRAKQEPGNARGIDSCSAVSTSTNASLVRAEFA